MSVHQCPAVGLAELECLPAVDGDVAAGSSMSVDVQLSSNVRKMEFGRQVFCGVCHQPVTQLMNTSQVLRCKMCHKSVSRILCVHIRPIHEVAGQVVPIWSPTLYPYSWNLVESSSPVSVKDMIRRNYYQALERTATTADKEEIKSGVNVSFYYLLKRLAKVIKSTYLVSGNDDDAAKVEWVSE